jgi:predicted permease
VTATVAFPASRYDNAAARIDAYDRTLAAIHTLPGVEAATWMSLLPTKGDGWVDLISAAGDTRPTFERPNANYRFIAPDFFRVAAVPILKGRTFSEFERDPKRPLPALVSARTAAVVWPGRDAIGQRFMRGEIGTTGFEVVGIVADVRMTTLDRTPPLVVYVPYWARSAPKASLMVLTAAAPSAFVHELSRALNTVDPEAAIGDVQTLDEVVDASLAGRRYQMQLFVVFSLVALAIAIVGVYGVTAYGVSRRRREMNIRVALGAQAAQVMRLVVGQGLVPVAVGVAAGVAAAAAIGGLVASLLFDVRPRDPIVIAAVAAAVALAAALSCLLAARQGLVIDPAAALRDE